MKPTFTANINMYVYNCQTWGFHQAIKIKLYTYENLSV
jgi:hypothetical protein